MSQESEGMVATSFSSDVVAKLRQAGPELRGHDALILPIQVRNGRSYYSADDVDAMRAARSANLNAAFLDSGERQHLEEFAAGWMLDLGLAVAQNLSTAGVRAAISYVWARVRVIVRRERHPGPEQEVPVRVKIARLEHDAQGTVMLQGLEITGPADTAVKLLAEVLARPVRGEAGLPSTSPASDNRPEGINSG